MALVADAVQHAHGVVSLVSPAAAVLTPLLVLPPRRGAAWCFLGDERCACVPRRPVPRWLCARGCEGSDRLPALPYWLDDGERVDHSSAPLQQ